jgi:hypothetical protein
VNIFSRVVCWSSVCSCRVTAAARASCWKRAGKEVDYVYLAGHGTGGTLSILEASRNPNISGLVLMAPRLDAPLVSGSWVASTFGWLVPAARWAEVIPSYTPYRYESRPRRLGEEVAKLVDATLTALPQRAVEVPVFTVLNQEDMTISTPAVMEYMAERVHPLSATLLYTGEPVPEELQPGIQVVQSADSQLGVLGTSHAGLVIPTEDLEFGYFGRSMDCGHYFHADPESYQLCREGKRAVQGEVNDANLATGLLERAEFNLFFYEMVREIDKLIAPVAKVPDYNYVPR